MTAKNKDTSEYRRKRDFAKTREPQGRTRASSRTPQFVIQEHAASSLHYDFRLEADGVLKSWAVPKGPSPDPRQKRLAVPTEDHPLEYADFEGTIPEGQYGGGSVIIWDAGTYENLGDDEITRGIEQGHISFWLYGEKLTGGYALTRVGSDNRERWLLVKLRDEKADARRNPVSTRRQSVRTGRSLRDVQKEES